MKINLSHGNGGVETSKLIHSIFMKYFINDLGSAKEDASVLKLNTAQIAFTTDSYVVKPIFFNGGDIGRLAVCGTVNDLLTSGATPKYISASFIIEEGFDSEDLHKVAHSMQMAAKESNTLIVTGDTKVIDGSGGIYINTSGIGELDGKPWSFLNAKAGDVLIVTGTLGDHHACIMSYRMGIKNDIASDTAPLTEIADSLRRCNITVHGMRDITRGGLATCLGEVSDLCGLQGNIYETRIPVTPSVSGLCDILGLDPLYMANEGKMFISVPKSEGELAIKSIRETKYGKDACIIGEFCQGSGVIMHTRVGGKRIIPKLSGEALPRIC